MTEHPHDQLYRSMAAHPDAGQVMDLLKIVDPVDDFSSALCLIRDCFSPNTTLRTLSRKCLRRLLKERLALLRAHETAVMQAAAEAGIKAQDYMQALKRLPKTTADELREAYTKQVAAMRTRPLKKT